MATGGSYVPDDATSRIEHGRLTPEQARNEAKKLLGTVAQGSDPIAERRKERDVPLFRDVASEYMRTHILAKRKPRTLDTYETLLRLHILPAKAP